MIDHILTQRAGLLDLLNAMEEEIGVMEADNADAMINGWVVRVERHWDPDKRGAYGKWFVGGNPVRWQDLPSILGAEQ